MTTKPDISSLILPPPPERRRLRHTADLSLEDIADVLGVSRSAVGRWETGNRTPRRGTRAAYAALLRQLAELEDPDDDH